jgi:branched-subunit amino acid ABC-type transport system permease component
MQSNRRRWLGGAFIMIAAGMLVLGQTVWREKLQGFDFIFYWLTCLTFTGTAAITALWDLFVIRFESREKQKELVHETLNALEDDQRRKEESGHRRGNTSRR